MAGSVTRFGEASGCGAEGPKQEATNDAAADMDVPKAFDEARKAVI